MKLTNTNITFFAKYIEDDTSSADLEVQLVQLNHYDGVLSN